MEFNWTPYPPMRGSSTDIARTARGHERSHAWTYDEECSCPRCRLGLLATISEEIETTVCKMKAARE